MAKYSELKGRGWALRVSRLSFAVKRQALSVTLFSKCSYKRQATGIKKPPE